MYNIIILYWLNCVYLKSRLSFVQIKQHSINRYRRLISLRCDSYLSSVVTFESRQFAYRNTKLTQANYLYYICITVHCEVFIECDFTESHFTWNGWRREKNMNQKFLHTLLMDKVTPVCFCLCLFFYPYLRRVDAFLEFKC